MTCSTPTLRQARARRQIWRTAVLLTALIAPTTCPCGESAEKEKTVNTNPPLHTNALAKETSPYLLQHAHNPVNWYPWGSEAFEKAGKEHKPVFLSVGYSSCHWCHVMERESFQNEEVAKVLNDNFVAIKVDREERPDIDAIYMAAVQLITQSGGWPMSVFTLPDGRPFFGGTYFPAEDGFGRMGFRSLLLRVAKLWKEQRKEMQEGAAQLSEAVREQLAVQRIPASKPLNHALLESFVDHMDENSDRLHGGFGARPKFPPSNALLLMLHLAGTDSQSPKGRKLASVSAGLDPRLEHMTRLTLDRMVLGGIHDHLAGGFHRYSTDEKWLVPHFEKMLYDNALLALAYAEASALYAQPEYARVARATCDWVLREMTSPEGAFYSALDADSEGQEGKFYLWSKQELDQVLGADAGLFCSIYNVREAGNFEDEVSGQERGLNILHLAEPLAAHAARLKMSEQALREKVEAAKAKLLGLRAQRARPGLDDKVLTSWNALMIASLARGAVLLQEPRYKEAAVRAAEFLLEHQRTAGATASLPSEERRWLATCRGGQSKLPAYLDDHAFLAVAFLELYKATGEPRWQDEAVSVVALLDKHFADKAGGGCFFTADDHERLLARTKDPTDKAIPSGNGMAAQALVELAVLTGDSRYREAARKLFDEFQGLMEHAPQATESMLLALARYLEATSPFPLREGAGGGAVPSGSKATRGPVTVELLLGQSALRCGAGVPLGLRLNIEKGWHVQAHTEAGAAGGLRFSLSPTPLGSLKALTYPVAETLSAPELGDNLQVYLGTVIAGALLAVSPDAPLGEQSLAVKVRFQACSDQVCQAPADVVLSLRVNVVESSAAVKELNQEVFKDLKLSK